MVGDLLELSGIGRDRMQLRWASAAEGPLFADYVKQFSELTQGLGAFDLEKFKLQLAAVELTLSTSRIRWLLGMTRQLTEQGNVYHEKLKDDEYTGLLKQAIEEEYHIALVLGALKEGPRSVREISKKIGLPIYTVSLRLNDLEKRGQVELKGYDGSTPRFISLAA